MRKSKKLSVKILSVLLSVLMLIGIVPMSISAFGTEGSVCSSRRGEKFIGYDGEPYSAPRDYDCVFYNADGSTYAQHLSGYNYIWHLLMTDSTGKEIDAYCIEAGVDFEESSGEYISSSGTNSRYYRNLPYSIQFGIMLSTLYGWTEDKSVPIGGINTDDYIIATQIIIWEYQQGLRTSPGDRINNGTIPADLYYNAIKGRPAELAYDWILTQMANHYTIPSFSARGENNAPILTLQWDKSVNRYTLTVTDTNNILSNIKFENSSIQITRDGNKYTISSSSAISSAVTIKCQKNISMTGGPFLVWGRPGYQTMATGAEDPVYFYFKVKTESDGTCRIQKTSEDGKVSGVSFNISGNGINQNVTTKTDGTVDIALKPGVYTVTEQSYDKYEPQDVQRVTVISGQTSTVTFNNKLRRGKLTVTKTSEDGMAEGIRFHLYGTSLSGIPVDEYATTNKDGVAEFKDILIGKGYQLEEVDTPVRYVIPDSQTASVEWNKVTERSFTNILKKWNATVTKRDSETSTPQGDSSLSGAVYGVFNGNQLIDTYITDANGQFTTKYYVCGDNWNIQELSPSEGYLLNTTSYHVGAEAKLYTVEYNHTTNNVTETVIKGNAAIIKHTNDGSTQIETPEVGAEFEVYLKRAGSYASAKESERDILICDEHGFAQTKQLPYGIYTVHQINGWDGREYIKDFDIYISENGQTYRYLINNAYFESYIKIIKTDAESGLAIPYSGAGFQLFDPDGNKIVMHYTYPEYTEIDTFYTTEDGMLITPQKLEYGKGYSIVEISAPYGYVLDSTPVYFDVSADTASEDGTITVVKVYRSNMSQKGVIKIIKTGEVFQSVMEQNGIYQPVYEIGRLSGAVFEIFAAEDVCTLDGVIHYAKGEIVDTVTTDSDGIAVSKELYLGKYEIKEVTAPHSMILNNEIRTVEITYAGQDIAISETTSSLSNERQKAFVSLEKLMDQNDLFNIGQNSEILSVQFGLFAAADLMAADGSVIPKDGLLETVRCNTDGKANFSSDLPVGANCYVKEIATDTKYILSDEIFPVDFAYAGQKTAAVSIKVNGGEPILNNIITGSVKGLKIDRETEETISGAVFGLFAPNESIFTAETALLTVSSGADGVFLFEGVPYGDWIIKELKPAENFLPNEEIYPVWITENEEIIEIVVVNDRIPEIGTNAAVDGEKEIGATEIFTLKDTVSYRHLIPGKEYTVSGVLMNKATGEPLLINGEEMHAETIFIPDAPSGEVIVSFTFDSRNIKTDTDIVVFESLYRDGKELAVHEDIDDEDQTITVKIPQICTTADVGGKKEINATEVFTLEDTVSYKNLTPGKEYIIKGVLMDKITGKPLVIDGEEIRSEAAFIPESADGEVTVPFTFDSRFIKEDTELVVYETLYRESFEIASHTDIEDKHQTVSVFIPEIGTQAYIEGEKESTVKDRITIEDTVFYKNLTPGKEYALKGTLMDKSTGKPLLIDGKEICSETTFIPETASGEIILTFTFEGENLKKTTKIVVFETVYREDVPIAIHADLEDAEQTVTVQVPPPSDSPQTGDISHMRLWMALTAVSGAAVILLIVRRRRYSK